MRERRVRPQLRQRFEQLRKDLETRLRRVYDDALPSGFDDLVTRMTRLKVRYEIGKFASG